MTVEEKIRQLNTAFQKTYYDTDLGFFNTLVPQWLMEMKELIEQFIQLHPTMKDNFDDSIRLLDTELEEVGRLLEQPNPSDSVKDSYLIAMKKNVPKPCGAFATASIYMTPDY